MIGKDFFQRKMDRANSFSKKMTGPRLFPEAKHGGWRLFLDEGSHRANTFSEEKLTWQILFPEEKNDRATTFS